MRFKPTLLAAAILAICGTASAQDPGTVKAPKEPKAPKAMTVADRAPSGDEELALAALEGLLAQPGDRALPILR